MQASACTSGRRHTTVHRSGCVFCALGRASDYRQPDPAAVAAYPGRIQIFPAFGMFVNAFHLSLPANCIFGDCSAGQHASTGKNCPTAQPPVCRVLETEWRGDAGGASNGRSISGGVGDEGGRSFRESGGPTAASCSRGAWFSFFSAISVRSLLPR